MKTPDVRRWTGVSAIAVAVFLAIESITTAAPARARRRAGPHQYTVDRCADDHRDPADTFLMAFLIVFLGAFRQLVNRRPDLSGSRTSCSALVFIAVHRRRAMDGGAALVLVDAGRIIHSRAHRNHSIMFDRRAVLLALVSAAATYLVRRGGCDVATCRPHGPSSGSTAHPRTASSRSADTETRSSRSSRGWSGSSAWA